MGIPRRILTSEPKTAPYYDRKENMKIPISERYILSLAEAAEYFCISSAKIRQMAKNNPESPWILWNGSHLRIKRNQFEKFLEKTNYV